MIQATNHPKGIITVGIIDNLLAKRRWDAALKELHKRIVDDSIATIKTRDNEHVIDDYKSRSFRHSTFVLYPIRLNRNSKYTQYIHAAITDDLKVTTPLSWETVQFLKDRLHVDLETVHEEGFTQYNNGESNRPFNKCYSTATIVWNDKN